MRWLKIFAFIGVVAVLYYAGLMPSIFNALRHVLDSIQGISQ
jgi:hypothetical protein